MASVNGVSMRNLKRHKLSLMGDMYYYTADIYVKGNFVGKWNNRGDSDGAFSVISMVDALYDPAYKVVKHVSNPNIAASWNIDMFLNFVLSANLAEREFKKVVRLDKGFKKNVKRYMAMVFTPRILTWQGYCFFKPSDTIESVISHLCLAAKVEYVPYDIRENEVVIIRCLEDFDKITL